MFQPVLLVKTIATLYFKTEKWNRHIICPPPADPIQLPLLPLNKGTPTKVWVKSSNMTNHSKDMMFPPQEILFVLRWEGQ